MSRKIEISIIRDKIGNANAVEKFVIRKYVYHLVYFIVRISHEQNLNFRYFISKLFKITYT